jgi:APA family basic amino acid/polyamine antiporter
MDYLTSSAHGGVQDIIRASSIVFFSYIGFAAIADAGGEVKDAKKNLPRGIVISVISIAVLYVLVALVTYGTEPLNAVESAGNVPAAAMLFLPSFIALYISFTAFIALVSDINPSILATSRLSFAWSKDSVVPKKLSELSKFHTPKWTLVMNGAIAIFIVLAFSEFIEAIDVTTIAILITYSLVCLATFVMPYKRPDLWKKAEVKYRGTWAISITGMITTLLLLGYIIQVSLTQFVAVVLWIGVGATVYHLTREHHQLDWRILREKTKGLKEMEDELVQKLKK